MNRTTLFLWLLLIPETSLWAQQGVQAILGDIGPGQLFPGIWDKISGGLPNPFGSNREVGQTFNGDPFDNLMLAGRALNHPLGPVRGKLRAHAAGLYRAGSKTGFGYEDRVKSFKKHAKGNDDFFKCLREKGF